MMILIMVFTFLIGLIVGTVVIWNYLEDIIYHKEDIATKNYDLFKTCLLWKEKCIEGKNISNYFIQNNYCSVAIYGMGPMGESLCLELVHDGICVNCAIDRAQYRKFAGIQVYNNVDDIPSVDIVVVTTIASYQEIKRDIADKVKCRVVSLYDIIADL